MKIVLYSRPDMKHTAGELRELLAAADAAGLEWLLHDGFAAEVRDLTGLPITAEKLYGAMPDDLTGEPDGDLVAVSYGGDGTFLDCVRLFGLHGIPVLGVNSGRLGFLANVPKEGMRQAFADLAAGKYTIEKRNLAHAMGDFPEKPDYPYAFNEFTIQRGGTAMISVEAYIDDEMVATYWGDGIIFSTPSGSTAYSLSVGGPVLAPGCECFVLSPIAPHNLTMRPVVVPDGSVATFRVSARDGRPYVTLDNSDYEVSDGAVFRVSKAEKSVFLVKLQNISFYDTLRNKMLWGFDRRDQHRE